MTICMEILSFFVTNFFIIFGLFYIIWRGKAYSNTTDWEKKEKRKKEGEKDFELKFKQQKTKL